MNLKFLQKIIFTIVITITSLQAFASHISGGEMIYDYLGAGSTPNTTKYRITLRLIRDDQTTGAQMPTSVWIAVFDYGTKSQYPSTNSHFVASRTQLIPVSSIISPCAFGDTQLGYTMGIFPFEVELPNNSEGYIASYETCCRINNITNVNSPLGTGGTGSTYTSRIPGSNQLASRINSSPRFPINVFLVCQNKGFSWDFSAIDPDNDSLVYSFSPAYLSLVATSSSDVDPAQPSSNPPPDYPSVPYQNGYTYIKPLGNLVNINPSTGLISGQAPPAGKYVVCVTVKEYRNGVLISEHRKDLILKVGNCDFAAAQLEPDANTCDGFTQNFVNLAGDPNGLIHTYHWDFGVLNLTNDTSNLPNPTYTYPDTGVYYIKLIINRGEPCSDSTVRRLGIYPGFFPNFTTSGVCYQSPIQFNDASTTQYGVVDSWRWDFGDAAVLSDTSHLKNPTYQYPSPGTKSVQFIVTNSKGCIDTLVKDIVVIDKPTITLPFRDTLICSIDTLQLQSTFSSGSASWLPNYRIINPNTNNPLVYPLVTTTYYVTANDQGCIQKDSIKVNVKDFVTVDVMPDTAICLTDAFKIRTNSDALSYVWTPAIGLSSTTVKEPITTPISSPIKYYVNANIGKCQSKDSITIIASPYPQVYAGLDTSICYGDQAQLHGTASGANFNWSPVNTLINSNTLQPISNTLTTTTYILTTQGAPGCPKPARDTVVVRVIPKIIAFAGNDTSIVVGQPLQLNATGATNYLWTPSSFLSNATIANPIATLTNHQTYIVKVSTIEGCFAYDTINITVFKTAPDIFVPTVFTPNADGTNDRLIPVPVGITKYDYFEVYNRWGQKLYRTTQVGIGWDGTFGGKQQNVDTYVWQVLGTDFTGKKVFRKGTVVLVR